LPQKAIAPVLVVKGRDYVNDVRVAEKPGTAHLSVYSLLEHVKPFLFPAG